MFSKVQLERILETAMSTGADFAEIFIENTRSSAMNMIDGSIDQITDNLLAGDSCF